MSPSDKLLPDVYVPTFEMKVGDEPLRLNIARNILQVSVEQVLNQAGSFSFRLHDPTLQFINRERGLFTEGKRVEISMGYLGNTRRMIVGNITALTPDFPSSGPATLEIRGYDRLHALTRGTLYHRFEGKEPNSGLSDSEIVSKMARDMKLQSSSVDGTPARSTPRVINHQTGFAFLEELAVANGYFFWVDVDTLYFKRTLSTPSPEIIALEWGKTLMSFSPQLNTAGQVEVVEVRGLDPQGQPFTTGPKRSDTGAEKLARTGQSQVAAGTGGKSERVITDAPVFSAQEAEAYARSIQAQQVLVSGQGTAVGEPRMRLGTMLKLSGIGPRFNGTYTVTRVTHTLGEGGYQTSFEINGMPYPADFTSLAGGRRRMPGVVIGTVKENKNVGIGQVKVTFPGMSKDEIGHLARIATLMAGKEWGAFFLPQVNDEVLIAFENGDISRPYIIGALWNGKNKPPEANADGNNNLRFIKSRSGHLIRLDDTQDKEKIEVIDKSGKNHIIIDTASNTITIKSKQDIHIEAPQGTIKLSAQKIEMSSQGETKVKAKEGLTLDGLPGNTTVKGTVVNIN
jgi:phage protein D/phage baseplate assembly protein gpV